MGRNWEIWIESSLANREVMMLGPRVEYMHFGRGGSNQGKSNSIRFSQLFHTSSTTLNWSIYLKHFKWCLSKQKHEYNYHPVTSPTRKSSFKKLNGVFQLTQDLGIYQRLNRAGKEYDLWWNETGVVQSGERCSWAPGMRQITFLRRWNHFILKFT